TWAAYDGLAELDRGLDILLTGLATRLDMPGGMPTRAPEPG
ncbi:TetR/AcrR family transcriptional regulator, partial [Mycolicibacterium porcinum]